MGHDRHRNHHEQHLPEGAALVVLGRFGGGGGGVTEGFGGVVGFEGEALCVFFITPAGMRSDWPSESAGLPAQTIGPGELVPFPAGLP